MLNDVYQILVELKLTTTPVADFEINVRFGHHLSCYLRSKASENYFVKVVPLSEHSTLENEYEALRKVHPEAPQNVPRPLGLFTRGNWHVLLLEDKPAITLSKLSDITHYEEGLSAWVDLLGHLTSCGSARNRKDPDLFKLTRFLEQHLPELSEYVSGNGILDAHGNSDWISQHGDMSATNVGWSGSTPVIYDWEDYGILGLPGFDLAVLVGSLLDFQPEPLLDILDENHPDHPGFRSLVEACNLSVQEYRERVPLYYGCFLWLKHSRGYTGQIQQQIHALIDALLRQPLGGCPRMRTSTLAKNMVTGSISRH